ncbi:MAG: CHASE domain-containing protein, partial [Alphaproteobacteria bacterium]|nr:CHASE domain-containing protein [Alphaproteobacteria bacterium]
MKKIKNLILSPVLAPVVFLIGVILSLALWYELSYHGKEALQKTLQTKAELTRNDIQKSLEANILTLKRMANRWEARNGTPKQEWHDDARNYVADTPGLTTVEWVDETYHVRWIEPLEGNEKAQGLYIAFEEERKKVLEGASERHKVTLTPPLDLVQGYKAFLVYLPVYTNNQFGGFIIGIYDIKKTLSHYLGDLFSEEYHIELFIDEKLAFQNFDKAI